MNHRAWPPHPPNAEVSRSQPAVSDGPPAAVARPGPVLDGLRILVADDCATTQTIVSILLETLGAHCVTADDGLDALAALEAGAFDIAVLDMEMPRLSGLELIRTLRQQSGPLAKLPVLALTASQREGERQAITAAGADGILAKPLHSAQPLATAIAAARDSATQRSAAPAPAVEAINHKRFDQLMRITGPDDARRLLRRLDDDLRRAGQDLSAAIAGGNVMAIRAATHVLIALAGTAGADRLHDLARATNDAAHEGDLDTMRRRGREVLEGLGDLIGFVSAELASRGEG